MRIVGVLLAIVVLLDLTPPATAANYQITDLGTLQGVGCVGPGPLPTIGMSSFATAINDRGQAAGGSCATYVDSHAIPHSVTHGFLWTDGAMADIGTLGLGTDRQPDESAVNGMNEAGQVVGRNFFSMTEGTAFLRSGGTMTSLATVLGGFSSALDINNSGQIVGLRGTLPDIASWSAFLYDPGTGQVTTLPGLGGTFRIEATAINDTGGIAGYAEATANKLSIVISAALDGREPKDEDASSTPVEMSNWQIDPYDGARHA